MMDHSLCADSVSYLRLKIWCIGSNIGNIWFIFVYFLLLCKCSKFPKIVKFSLLFFSWGENVSKLENVLRSKIHQNILFIINLGKWKIRVWLVSAHLQYRLSIFGLFGYAKMSLYDCQLSLVSLLLLLLLLASLSVDSCSLENAIQFFFI